MSFKIAVFCINICSFKITNVQIVLYFQFICQRFPDKAMDTYNVVYRTVTVTVTQKVICEAMIMNNYIMNKT